MNKNKNLFILLSVVVLIAAVIFFVTGSFKVKEKNSQALSLSSQTSKAQSVKQLNSQIEQFISKNPKAVKTIDPKLSTLLSERKAAILKEVKVNPGAIKDMQLSPSLQTELQASRYGDIEKKVTLTGHIEIMHHDDFDNPENQTFEYYLTLPDGTHYPLYSLQKNLAPSVPVIFSGYQLDDVVIGTVAILDSQKAGQEASSTQKTSPGTPVSPFPVNHKIAVFLVTIGAATPLFTQQEAHDHIFDEQFQNFFDEQSYHRIVFSGDVFGWINVPNATQCSSGLWDNEIVKYIKQNNIDITPYQHVLFLQSCDLPAGPIGGWSSVGPWTYTFSGNTYTTSQTWLSWNSQPVGSFLDPVPVNPPLVYTYLWRYFDNLLSHEMGHAIGLLHANGYDCDTQSLGNNCEHMEYGNTFDVMGGSGFSKHFNGFYKNMLGWILPQEQLTISSSGSYTINTLEGMSGKKFATISNPSLGTGALYAVEYRKPTGFDSILNSPNLTSNTNGLLIHRVHTYTAMTPSLSETRIIDANPTSLPWYFIPGDLEEAALIQPNVLNDSNRGITIGPITNTTSSSITFDVSINTNLPSCTHVTPTMTFNAPYYYSLSGSGGTMNFDYKIHDNDPVKCGQAQYITTITFPAAFGIPPYSIYYSIDPDDVNIHPGTYIGIPAVPVGSYIIKFETYNTAFPSLVSAQATTLNVIP